MKKIIFILLFVLSMFSFSQETNKIAEQQFLDYNQLIANKNFEKAIDRYAPEEFLKIFPKDMLIKTFEQLFNNPKMKFTLYSPIIKKLKCRIKE